MMNDNELIDYLYSVEWDNYNKLKVYSIKWGETTYKFKTTGIGYSDEELDFFINNQSLSGEDDEISDNVDLEIIKSLKIEHSFAIKDYKKTANISSDLNRIDLLLKTLESIEGQFDEVRIYLNEADHIPDRLSKYNVKFGKQLHDSGKFLWSSNKNEYYFCLSDDVIYPGDYVKKTLPEVGNRIVCYSGKKINSSNLDDFHRNHRDYDISKFQKYEVSVDVVNSSTMVFNTDYFSTKVFELVETSITDLFVSMEIAMKNLEIVCLPKDNNWIIAPNTKIYKSYRDDDEIRRTDILKMISLYKKIPPIELNKENIFGTIDKESIDLIANRIQKLSQNYTNFYHIGCGIGTNLLHLTKKLKFDQFFGVDTDEMRIRFSNRTFSGIKNLITQNISFFRTDLSRLMIDKGSIILINPFYTEEVIDRFWDRIPKNTIVMSFHQLIRCKSIDQVDLELKSGNKLTLFIYKKDHESSKDYEFRNIPFLMSKVIHKGELNVPKIIHHIAPKNENDWHYKWKECLQSWLDYFPDFQHMFWDDEDIEKLVDEEYSWYKKYYNLYDKNIKRYDMARPLILYKYGGIYADMDYITYRNFYDLIPNNKISTPISPLRQHEYFQNALFISNRLNPFWLMIIDSSIDFINIKPVLDSTGPKLITYCYFQYYPICKNLINALPHEKWCPFKQSPDYDSPEVITKHFYSNNWVVKNKIELLDED